MFTTDIIFYARLTEMFYAGSSASLSDEEKALADSALARAYRLIQTKLVGRGLTLTEIDTWAMGSDYQLDCATYSFIITTRRDKYNEEDEAAWSKVFYTRCKDMEQMAIIDEDGTVLDAAKDNEKGIGGGLTFATFTDTGVE